jgi:hypothetical protein
LGGFRFVVISWVFSQLWAHWLITTWCIS